MYDIETCHCISYLLNRIAKVMPQSFLAQMFLDALYYISQYSQTSEVGLNLAKNTAKLAKKMEFGKENYGVKRGKTAMAKKIIHLLSH